MNINTILLIGIIIDGLLFSVDIFLRSKYAREDRERFEASIPENVFPLYYKSPVIEPYEVPLKYHNSLKLQKEDKDR